MVRFTLNGAVAFLENWFVKTLSTFAGFRIPEQPPALLPVSFPVTLQGGLLICSQATADNKFNQLISFRVHAL